MDVRGITTHTFPELKQQGVRKGNQPAEEPARSGASESSAATRHPALTAEEQRYFESAFPVSAQDKPGAATYSGGGAMRQPLRSGTLVDRKV
jgi:hypothetical protein